LKLQTKLLQLLRPTLLLFIDCSIIIIFDMDMSLNKQCPMLDDEVCKCGYATCGQYGQEEEVGKQK